MDPALQGRWTHKQYGNKKWWMQWYSWTGTTWWWLNLPGEHGMEKGIIEEVTLSGFGKMNRNIPGRQEGMPRIWKSECVTPGVHREGNAHFLPSSIIADYDHIHLFGSTTHSWLTETVAKVTIFLALFCHIDPHRPCQWVITLYQGNKSKPWAPSSVPLWSWFLGSEEAALSLLHSAREPLHLHQFPLLSPSHISF